MAKPRTRPNGAGTAFKRGKVWYAQVTVGYKVVERDGVPHNQAIRVTRGGFPTKREALAYCPKLLEESRNTHKRPQMTLQQIWDAWSPVHEQKVSKSAMDCYRSAYKWFSAIHNRPMNAINLDDLQECVDACPRGKRVKENMKITMSMLYKYAVPRHQSDLNYAEYLTTGNGKKGTRPSFTKEQVESIRKQIGVVPHAEYVYCMIYTGFRPAEMLQLKKEDYRDGILYGGIKTEAGKNRAVPVSPKIMPYILQQMQSECIYLFGNDDGSQMATWQFRDYVFYPTLAAAGIQEIPTKGNPAYFVPYSCRHTFSNLLKNVNGADKDKASLMGHEDYVTTKKHYQSAELDALRAIVNEL